MRAATPRFGSCIATAFAILFFVLAVILASTLIGALTAGVVHYVFHGGEETANWIGNAVSIVALIVLCSKGK